MDDEPATETGLLSLVVLPRPDPKKENQDGDEGGEGGEAREDGNETGEEKEEEEEDWFSKLTSDAKEPRLILPDGTSSDHGLNHAEIPLLWENDLDFKEKTMRTLRVGLEKMWRRGSATITAEDPTYKVAYLGNVLTGWAKGDGCIDKPLTTLWKNYNGSTKPDVQMKMTVTRSGLKAVTKDHGLVEYWSHRITYCTVPAELPRIFCWVYRHEGKKLKPELRCHAVLCSKGSVATRMSTTLRLRLAQALTEFKRDKLLRQNARLSLANSVYDNPSLPRRKILLSTGFHNYKPPLERSKSAPKLKPIEETLEEEENSPRARRKRSGAGEPPGDDRPFPDAGEETAAKKSEDKCEFKLTNINFVKKLCSSIENLVESTSNYGKKLLTERKSAKDSACAKPKKPEEDGNFQVRKCKPKRKNVTFEESAEEGEAPKTEASLRVPVEVPLEAPLDLALEEVRDRESDEGSNSLRSLSSCCSDGSSLTDCSDGADAEEANKVAWDPAGGEGGHAAKGSAESEMAEGGKREEKREEEEQVREYAELAENLAKRLSLDRKEKDVPYHKIIKSNALRPRQLQSSCVHV